MSEDKTTPWRTEDVGSEEYWFGDGALELLDRDGNLIAAFPIRREKEAALTLKAVNSHDKLVKAARAAQRAINSTLRGEAQLVNDLSDDTRRKLEYHRANLHSVLAEVEG